MAVEIRQFQDSEAAALAKLFEACDAGWPEGFFNGALYAPEAFLELVGFERQHNIFVAWQDGEAVGYADLLQLSPDEPVGYLGLLTAHPERHGTGIGRDLIGRVIERCVELGFKRLDLNTWPGNTKAVPLYKKTGFFWGPKADHLENYMPFLLSHPFTKPFFERHDWYQTYQRDLGLGFDEEQRHGALVYPYCFQSQDEQLRAVFDQQTHKLVELDTPELAISLSSGGHELSPGASRKAKLSITNRTDQAMMVAVRAAGEKPLSAELLEAFIVASGQTVRREVEMRAAADAVGTGQLQLTVLVDDQKLELAASIQVVSPVELRLEPANITLMSRVSSKAIITTYNRTDHTVTLELYPLQTSDLEVRVEPTRVAIEPGAFQTMDLSLTASSNGSYQISILPRITSPELVELPRLELRAVAVADGQMVVSQSAEGVRVVTIDRTVEIPSKGGELGEGVKLRESDDDRALLSASLAIGPPYYPERRFEPAEVQVEQGPAAVRLTARSLSKETGLILERAIDVALDGTVRLTSSLTNTGTDNLTLEPFTTVEPYGERGAWYPLREGVVHGEGGLPAWHFFGPGAISPVAEPWMAFDVGGWTVGASWEGDVTLKSSPEGWARARLISPLVELAPGKTWTASQVTLLSTRNGWEEIARQARSTLGNGGAEVMRAATVRVSPCPVLLQDEPRDVEVQAISYYPRTVSGAVRLDTPSGVTAEPSGLAFQDVNCTNSPSECVTLSARGSPRAAPLSIHSELPLSQGTVTTPVIVLGGTGEVRTARGTDQGVVVWTVDNGLLSFSVRPDALASMYSLRSPDGEWLYSSFPRSGAFRWWYPIYGGVTPVLRPAPEGRYPSMLGELEDIVFEAESTEREGSQGVRWQGVRLRGDVTKEDLRGLSFGIEYLTTPNSNVIAIISTLHSNGPARCVVHYTQVWPSSSPEVPSVVYPNNPALSRSGIREEGTLFDEFWGAVAYRDREKYLVLVNARGTRVMSSQLGLDGTLLESVMEAAVRPDKNAVSVSYLVLADDRDQAQTYASLAELRGL